MALENYVKFLRGTPTAYEKAIKDNDTLYFISESDESTTGVLYLGSKLIAGGTITGSTTLEELEDVLLSAGIVDGSLLVYDGQEKKWVNKQISDVLEMIVPTMKGASETEDGVSGLVPTPIAGQHEMFLRGDGTWATPISKETLEGISTLQSTVNVLVGNDTGKSVREISFDVLTEALIPEDAKESLDTLQEISAWIQDHPDDIASINASISDLDGRVVVLENSLSTAQNDISAIKDDIIALEEAMKWQEMSE